MSWCRLWWTTCGDVDTAVSHREETACSHEDNEVHLNKGNKPPDAYILTPFLGSESDTDKGPISQVTAAIILHIDAE